MYTRSVSGRVGQTRKSWKEQLIVRILLSQTTETRTLFKFCTARTREKKHLIVTQHWTNVYSHVVTERVSSPLDSSTSPRCQLGGLILKQKSKGKEMKHPSEWSSGVSALWCRWFCMRCGGWNGPHLEQQHDKIDHGLNSWLQSIGAVRDFT